MEEHSRPQLKYVNKYMKIIIKDQNSNLINEDVKWYLFDEKLWITQCNDYLEVEKSISESIGSFNWLYEINDTVLFDKEGRFETAIIDVSNKIKVSDIEDNDLSLIHKKDGDLYLAARKNTDFEFPSSVNYIKNRDILFSLPTDFNKQQCLIIYIVKDFGFVVMNDRLQGWMLENASKHICLKEGFEKNISCELLEEYLNAIRMWEENDENRIGLKNILESIKEKEDPFCVALKEVIEDLL